VSEIAEHAQYKYTLNLVKSRTVAGKKSAAVSARLGISLRMINRDSIEDRIHTRGEEMEKGHRSLKERTFGRTARHIDHNCRKPHAPLATCPDAAAP